MDQRREKSSSTEKSGQNTTPVLQRAIYRMSSIRSTALQIPHHTQSKLSFHPSYHSPGSPTIKKHVASEYLSQPLLGEAKFFSGPEVNEVEVGHIKTKRRFRMPRSFAILLFLLACVVIVGVIFGIVSAEVFAKRGYFKREVQAAASSLPIVNVPAGSEAVASAPLDRQNSVPVTAPTGTIAPEIHHVGLISNSLVENSHVAIPPENKAPMSNAFDGSALVSNVPVSLSASTSQSSIQDQDFSNLLQVLRIPGPLHKMV